MTAAIRSFCRRPLISAQRAYAQAGIGPEDMDFFELHDAFTIMAALSLEACGFAPRGEGVRWRWTARSACRGACRSRTMGGLKARGHPVGATGRVSGRRGRAAVARRGRRQPAAGCRLGMTQNIGGSGANVITHILERTS